MVYRCPKCHSVVDINDIDCPYCQERLYKLEKNNSYTFINNKLTSKLFIFANLLFFLFKLIYYITSYDSASSILLIIGVSLSILISLYSLYILLNDNKTSKFINFICASLILYCFVNAIISLSIKDGYAPLNLTKLFAFLILLPTSMFFKDNNIAKKYIFSISSIVVSSATIVELIFFIFFIKTYFEYSIISALFYLLYLAFELIMIITFFIYTKLSFNTKSINNLIHLAIKDCEDK